MADDGRCFNDNRHHTIRVTCVLHSPWVGKSIEAGMLVAEYIHFGGWMWASWMICAISSDTSSSLITDRVKTRLVALRVGGRQKKTGQSHPWECISTMQNSLEIQMGVGKPKFVDNLTMVLRPYDHVVDLSRCTLVVGESSVLTTEAAMATTYNHVLQQLARDPRYATWMHEVSLY
jgi:hypothetical protein